MRRAKHEQIARVERGQLAHFLASYRRSKAKAKAKVLPEPQRPICRNSFWFRSSACASVEQSMNHNSHL